MHRVFHKLLAFCFILALSLGWARPAHGQSQVQLTLFDEIGQPITSLTDGDNISLKIELADPLSDGI